MLEWGNSENFFRMIREDRGVPHPADSGRPVLPPNCNKYYFAYVTLGRSRLHGANGPQAIQVSEIAAYLDIAGITDSQMRMKYLRLCQKLDRVELDYIAKKRKN